MQKHINKIGIIGVAMFLAMAGSATVFALPSQASVHAQTTHVAASTNVSRNSHKPSQATTGKANGAAHLAAAQLTACTHRQTAINNIMLRIDTRAQNQINLFSTIATRVEAFYTKQGKTVANYSQLVAAVSAAKAQALSDFATVKTNSTFNCSSSNPKGMVTAFQGYLKTEISDLQNFKLAVKNLIVGVASANGAKLSASTNVSSTSTSAQTSTNANQGVKN